MLYTTQHIAAVIGATNIVDSNQAIQFLLTDSRRLVAPAATLFFALPGERRDGHAYIEELMARGVTAFVVRENHPLPIVHEQICFLVVKDVLLALQQLAAHHRQQFSIPVIGITGSNGKTIVKEWLYQLLQEDEVIVRSPRSYNSQVGVPLSVWLMNERHTLALFEAGISTTGEMRQLADIIRPTIGIFTNLSDAHSEGFGSNVEKGIEKFQLFSQSDVLVYAADETGGIFSDSHRLVERLRPGSKIFSWSRYHDATLQVKEEQVVAQMTAITAVFRGEEIRIQVPFTDKPSVNNVLTCWITLAALGYAPETISQRLQQLEPIDMRLQLMKAVNQCTLLNDSYSNDETSLSLAIDYQMQQAGGQPAVLILSDLLTAAVPDEELYLRLSKMIQSKGIKRFIGIGPRISNQAAAFKKQLPDVSFFPDTDTFLKNTLLSDFQSSIILIKGARVFQLEKIANWLALKTHQTQLIIHLGALSRNIKKHQSLMGTATKLMVVLKAFGYGSGSTEIARMLQYQQVHYLAVAYIDEGIELRKAGIRTPIMVMNAEESGWEAMLQYQLEPELYSTSMTDRFILFLKRAGFTSYPVHLKINTGMNRLGFDPSELPDLLAIIVDQDAIRIQTVFSHFVASEDPAADDFTREQLNVFIQSCEQIRSVTGYSFLRHIANSSAIQRHPAAQLDMVRLGMGMYGTDRSGQLRLEPVATLSSTIAQVRHVPAGRTVGYGRKAVLGRDTIVAVVNIGYADGFSRRLGNGVGAVWVAGQRAKVLGHVCMDMTMVDVTDIPGVVPGMEVEIFGKNLTIDQMALATGTITYEIMTGISARVKRVYVEE
ncbi:MAG: bifunctional UDP-N-acetylmuramoyl-tripeptide:D-alanyl-D-alanine ligase/alanine racemase [Bacteroidota bacterium]